MANNRPSTTTEWMLCFAGGVGLVVVFFVNASDATNASSLIWPPFVLVMGLLMIGFTANEDNLFQVLGTRLARSLSSDVVFYVVMSLVVVLVTAVLNLDTAVAFLTPVFVFSSRSRGMNETSLLYAVLMLANAGSLFLPGSNLTNLIVLGREHISGLHFLSSMWLPALAAVVVSLLILLTFEMKTLRVSTRDVVEPAALRGHSSIVAVLLAAVFVLLFRSPALPVFLAGIAAVSIHFVRKRGSRSALLSVLGLPTLAGLFGIAVTLGTIGRVWSAPATAFQHLNVWGTGAVTALGSVLVNNLPAASLVAARAPAHPFAALVGLNLGPNLCVTGSLAWLLWLRSARIVETKPSLRQASLRGAVITPVSLCAALVCLSLSGGH